MRADHDQGDGLRGRGLKHALGGLAFPMRRRTVTPAAAARSCSPRARGGGLEGDPGLVHPLDEVTP